MKPGRVFQFSEPGSRVLREFMAERERQRLIAARGRSAMQQRDWWSGVAGVGGSGFAGAGVNRLTQSLAQWSGSVNSDLDGNIGLLRARGRQLCANNEHGRRFLSLVANNIIGAAGPTLQVRAYTLANALDKVANDAIEMAWARWCSKADVRGLMDYAELQRVAVKAVARDGETLIRVVRNNGLPHGIGLQLLEADRLDEAYNTTLQNGNVVRLGVEVNTLLQPVALWLKSRHPGDSRDHGSTRTERVGINDVLHVYLTDRAEQVRGYTWLHAVLLRMNMLHAYEEAAVVAARVGAAKMGVFRRTETAPSALAGMADSVDANGVPQMSAEAGEFMQLPQGWELQNWDPEYPQANFDSFLKACFRGIAAGLDVAAHNLTGDMTEVNYSSARIAELSERDAWACLQKWWIQRVSLPVYRAWLERALLRGEIRFPDTGKALPADKLQKFTDAARFQPRTWKWVDPAKDIAAIKDEIALGINSRTAVAASQGREIEDIIDELAQENALLKAAGLPTSVDGASAPAPAPVEPEDDDQDEDKAQAAEEDRAERRALMVAALRLLQQNEQSSPAPTINVDARSTIHVPPSEINLEANLPTPEVQVAAPNVEVRNQIESTVINVEPAPVNVEVNTPSEIKISAMPERQTVSTTERNSAGEIVKVVQREKDI